MTTARTVFAVLLSVSLMWAQPSPTGQSSSTTALRDLASEVEFLRKALAETQAQVAAQQREIEALKNVSKGIAPAQNGQVSGPAGQARPDPQTSSVPSTLDPDLLERRHVWGSAVLRTVFVPDSRTVVRGSGDPKNAHLSMVFAGLPYILPSTSGTLERVARPQ